MSMYLCDRFLLVQHVNEAENEDGGHVHWEWDEEHEEVAIVPTTDAVVHPRTVMIENLFGNKNCLNLKLFRFIFIFRFMNVFDWFTV